MITGAIYSFFKRVFTLFIRAAAWLIVALSLWIPLLYSIAFLIICASVKRSPAEVATVFWAGLAVSVVAAFFLSGFIYERRRKAGKIKPVSDPGERVDCKSDKAKLKKREKEDSQAEQLQPQAQNQPQQQSQPQTQPQPQPQYYQPQNQPYAQPQMQPQPPFPPQPQPQYAPYAQPKSEPQFGHDDLMSEYRQPVKAEFMLRKDSFGGNAYEKSGEYHAEPKIFATRKDPTIFVYEYPDRLEYYKRTRDGMVLMETKYKNNH